MARDTYYLNMIYGEPSVHHLEPEIVKTWNPFKLLLLGTPHRQVFDKLIWEEPIPNDILRTMETNIREAIGKVDEKYQYAFDGCYKIDERRTSIEVHLGMENELWEEILSDFFAHAGTPNFFTNISHTHNLDNVFQKYGKRLKGFYVKDIEQAA